jgi:hypothetical protein
MTLHLLDADVLIRADEDYYPVDRVAPFWAWLLQQAAAGSVKMAQQNYVEIADSRGLLAEWLNRADVKEAIVLDEPTDVGTVQRVLTRGYAPDLTDVDLEKIGCDPFLIAAALRAPDRVVVTREVSRPSAQRANRKVPDVCQTFGVPCINDFALWRKLNFSIR